MTHLRIFLPVFIIVCMFLPQSAHADTNDLNAQVQALTAHIERLVSRIEIARGNIPTEPLSSSRIEDIIHEGTKWLKNAQEESGRFRYEYVPYEGIYLNDDNIVRQAGTFYQLGEIARKDTARTYDLEETMMRAINYFDSLAVEDTYNEATFRCIVTPGDDTCKLGSTSLALVGILSVIESYPEHTETYEELAHDFSAYIQAMKKSEDGFRNRHRVNNELQSGKESSFSNGEAMLALARYYQMYPTEEVRTILEDMFTYIETEVPYDTPLYLWAIAALIDMEALWPNDRHIAYARAYTDWRVDGFLRRKSTQNNMCAYVEGIASAYVLLKEHQSEAERQELKKEIDFWLRKTEDLQITEDDLYRVLTPEGATITLAQLAEPEIAYGGFLTSEHTPTQRIDFTQHCLNAYLIDLVDIRGEVLGIHE